MVPDHGSRSSRRCACLRVSGLGYFASRQSDSDCGRARSHPGARARRLVAIIIYLMSNSLFTWQEWARARRLAPRAQVRRDLMITKLPLRGRRAADWKHMLRLRRAYAMTYGKCWRSCAPAGAHSPPFPPPWLVPARGAAPPRRITCARLGAPLP